VGDNAGRVILLCAGKLPDEAYRIVVIPIVRSDNNRPFIYEEEFALTRDTDGLQ